MAERHGAKAHTELDEFVPVRIPYVGTGTARDHSRGEHRKLVVAFGIRVRASGHRATQALRVLRRSWEACLGASARNGVPRYDHPLPRAVRTARARSRSARSSALSHTRQGAWSFAHRSSNPILSLNVSMFRQNPSYG